MSSTSSLPGWTSVDDNESVTANDAEEVKDALVPGPGFGDVVY